MNTLNREPIQQEIMSNINPPETAQLDLDQSSAQNPDLLEERETEFKHSAPANITQAEEVETDETEISSTLTVDATYSLEDNKLRLYCSERLSPDLYKKVRDAGYIWAPKQQIFVAPMWTPYREELALNLAGSIENEETSLEDRAADRAARFENYSEKRGADAERLSKLADSLSEPFAMGQPILVGHHSEKKARKLQARIHSTMSKAVSFYDQSNYWATRSEDVLRHAARKSKPGVRIRRIKGLEADLRRQEKQLKSYADQIAALKAIETQEQAQAFFNCNSFRFKPTEEQISAFSLSDCYFDNGFASCYQLIKKGLPFEVMREKLLNSCAKGSEFNQKWADHYTMRIKYEREMLAASGHTMPDFKAIAAEKRKKTTAAPIINTDSQATHVNHWNTTLKVFTITKEQFKKLSARDHIAVYRSACGKYRLRVCMNLWLKDYGLQYGPNESHSSHAIFIKDQKRVEVPTAEAAAV